MIYKATISVATVLVLLLLDVGGWWATLFLWAIPTLSAPLSQLLSFSIWNIVLAILFFTVWLAIMVYGVIFLAMIIHEASL